MKFRRTRAAEQAYLSNLNTTFSSLLRSLSASGISPDDAKNILQEFQNSPKFQALADQSAHQMITAQKVENARSWREAAMIGTHGREIYKALKQEVETGFDGYVQRLVMQNADLIKSLPNNIARDMNAKILKWAMEGLRHEDIAERLRELTKDLPKDIKANLKLIARTELSKANTAITEARCQEMDIRWYIWQTAKDGERVRPSHQLMQDVVVPWANPPNPEALKGVQSPFGHYHAGGCPNCRCYAEPIVALELLPDSFKVYTGGGIQDMNQAEFGRLIAG